MNRKWGSIKIFTLAGNNEDYAVAESIPLELDYSVEYPAVDFRKTSFPARYIYEVLLPNLVAKHAPDMYYHRGSPYSGSGKPSYDQKHGDIHQWNVWHVSPTASPAICFGTRHVWTGLARTLA
jgi:beta-mannosidase